MTAEHTPTRQTRDAVALHAAIGTPHAHIGRILEIDPKTLRKHYRDELDLGMSRANAAIAGKLYTKAINGDTTSQIFWLKTRAQWRETNRHEVTGPDGGPVQFEDVTARDRLAARLAAMSQTLDTEDPTP